MKYIFCLLLFIFSATVFAQQSKYGCLTINSEKEGPFYLFLDGVKINEEPQTSVRAIHLIQYSYAVKIVFVDSSLNAVEKQKLFICNKKGEKKEFTYNFTKDSGQLKFNFVSMIPVNPFYKAPAGVFVYDATSKKKEKVSIQKDVVKVKVDKKDTIPAKSPKILIDKKQQESYGGLTIISEREGPFYLFLDGVSINDQPQTYIRAVHLSQYSYAVKIIFIDTSKNIVEKQKLFICNKKGEKKEFTYNFIKDSGLLKLNFVSMVPVNPSFQTPPEAFIYDPIAPKKTVVKVVKDSAVKVVENKAVANQAAAQEIITKLPETNDNVVNGLVIMEPQDWSCGREWPMHKDDFNKALLKINSESSPQLRMKLAKSFAEKNCLKTEQIIELNMLFKTGEERLEFSKFAFKYAIDIKNYYKVSGVFGDNSLKSAFIYFISH